MSDLPKGWIETSLENLCTIARGGSPRPIQEYLTNDPNGINWIKISDATESEKYIFKTKQKIIHEGVSRSRLVKDGDFILSNSMSFGRPYIVKIKGCIHDGWLVLGNISKILDQDYLYYFLSSEAAYRQFDSMAAGSTVRNLNIDIVKTVKAFIPPLNEQHRIVAKLDTLFSHSRKAREELDRVPKLIARYKQAVLSAACSGQLTEDWREENPDVEPAEELLKRIKKEKDRLEIKGKHLSHINADKVPFLLPKEWIWTFVDNISSKVVDGVHKKPNYVENGIPFVTVKNLTSSKEISFENIKYISIEEHEEFIKRANPEKGDILITKDGTLGVTRLIRSDQIFSIFVSVALVKPIFYEMGNYLEFAFSSPLLQNQMVGTGSGLLHIHLIDLRGYFLPIPPLLEQQEIVRRVEKLFKAIDQMEEQYQKASKLLDRLEQATLSKAFRGELVPQDPNDIPASVLLEGILAERKDQPKNKGTKVKKTG